MDDNKEKIDLLNHKIDELISRQKAYIRELNTLTKEVRGLRNATTNKVSKVAPSSKETVRRDEAKIQNQQISDPTKDKQTATSNERTTDQQSKRQPKRQIRRSTKKGPKKINLEKFIGENLINKIGILITIIGVLIGAKYSIDNELVSPVTRITLAYIFSLGLLGFGYKLKSNYRDYSAVLVGGAITLLYVTTYLAYDFYALITMPLCFGLMFVFTIFAVIAALSYNRQIIALLGLVGAYAIPFLIGNDTGDARVLLGYLAVINIGVLIISLFKYWKPLLISAYVFTWLIFSFALLENGDGLTHQVAFLYLSSSFCTFYAGFLGYKLYRNETFNKGDIFLIMSNAFLFFGYGILSLSKTPIGEDMLGLFALANGLIHFSVAATIYQYKMMDKQLFYLIVGLVLVFITIAIPIQLDGHWVGLFWIAEAALVFWIGRTKGPAFYEYMSYPLLLLGMINQAYLSQNWVQSLSYRETNFTPLFNGHFLSALIFGIALGFINYIHYKQPTPKYQKNWLIRIAQIVIPVLLLYAVYTLFENQISAYWNSAYHDSKIFSQDNYSSRKGNMDLRKFKSLWLINYKLVFACALALINFYFIKDKRFGLISLVGLVISTLLFLTQGLVLMDDLRRTYLLDPNILSFQPSFSNISIRYLSYPILLLAIYCIYRLVNSNLINKEDIGLQQFNLHIIFEVLAWVVGIIICSSELVNILDLNNFSQSDKLGVSILWGSFALIMVAIGIWKNKKHLRLMAIVLFFITLAKLFFYDIAHLSSISKTILFICLGVLLLIISFLYNKFTDKITDNNDDTNNNSNDTQVL